MTTLFQSCRHLLPLLLLGTGAASAQQVLVQPLSADPARAVYAPSGTIQMQQRGITALALPFFDDFTTPLEGAPKAQNWTSKGGALVTNRLGINSLTRGTATLDGLKANGRVYSGVTAGQYGVIDSLQSQPIDLSGLTPADGVFLSFAWQAGSIVSVPNSSFGTQTVRLVLLVKTNTGAWEQAWVYNSLARRTPFRQQVVDLNQAKYLHGSFQFMFVASGNRSDNSDNWGIDYVLLNRGRSLTDTTYTDYATAAGLRGGNPSGGLRSPLRRFTAMPVWQFNAAAPATSELNPQLGVNIVNLRSGIPSNINFQGTARLLPNGPDLGSWLQLQLPLLASPRQNRVTGSAASLALPTTAGAKTLRYTLAMQTNENNPLTQPNDTIFRDVELNNYYAYDDGTAENITEIFPYPNLSPASLAYRFDLNQPDYVRGLRLYPVFTASSTGNRSVTISVWDGVAGKPANAPRASKTAIIPNPLPAGFQYFEITFDTPVPVTGTFYVGYSQPSSGIDQHYGLDLNSSFPYGYLWQRSNVGVWDSVPRNALRGGALMMRPVMTNNVATATTPATREAAAFGLYPNPAHGSVGISGPAFARAAVVDAVGRTVWVQPAAQAGQPTLALPPLPPGLYTVRLTLDDGRSISRRLELQ